MISMTSIGSAAGMSKYLTAEAAVEYYAQEQSPSSWGGKGAELMGLEGPVAERELTAVLNGHVMQTNDAGEKELVQLGRTRINKETGERTKEHRAGSDMTFAPPKSVSLEALVFGNDTALEAHRAGVSQALDYMEKHAAQTRIDGKMVETGNLLYAQFEHVTSRAGDPLLHTHTLVANATMLDGKAYSLSNEKLMQHRTTADSIYLNAMAEHLENAGIRTVWNGRGSFEIEGYTRENIEVFSKRNAEISQQLEARGETKESASWEARQVGNHDTRADKAKDHQENREAHQNRWQAEAVAAGIERATVSTVHRLVARTGTSANELVASAVESLADREQEFSKKDLVKEAMQQSAGRVSIKDVLTSIDRQKKSGELVSRDADRTGARFTTREAIAAENWASKQLTNGRDAHTSVMSSREFDKALKGFNSQKTKDLGTSFALNAEQVAAARMILTNDDQFSAVQGLAGTGKTTMLEFVRVAAESKGWEVKGFSNGAEQAKTLQEDSGIKSTTNASFLASAQAEKRLQAKMAKPGKVVVKELVGTKFLTKNGEGLKAVLGGVVKDKWRHPTALDKAIYYGNEVIERAREWANGGQKKVLHINDEAGMSGQKEFNSIIGATQQAGAKTIFVGDTAQHQSVQAGSAMALALRDDKIQVARLEKISRQKTEQSKAPVRAILDGQHAQGLKDTAFETSGARQAVEARWSKVEADRGQLTAKEVLKRKDELSNARKQDNITTIQKLAHDYVAMPSEEQSKTAIITATHVDRQAINAQVRENLKAVGDLGNGVVIDTLRSKDMTTAQSRQASSYTPGDVLRSQTKNSTSYWQVEKVSSRGVTIKNNLGIAREISGAKAAEYSAFTVQKREFSVGDKVAFFEKNKQQGVNNGTVGTVLKIDGDRLMAVQIGDKVQVIDLHAYKQIDHGYAMTSMKSQGKTVDRALVHGQREWYVNATRARKATIVYTQDREKAGQQAEKMVDKTVATLRKRRVAVADKTQAKPLEATAQNNQALNSMNLFEASEAPSRAWIPPDLPRDHQRLQLLDINVTRPQETAVRLVKEKAQEKEQAQVQKQQQSKGFSLDI